MFLPKKNNKKKKYNAQSNIKKTLKRQQEEQEAERRFQKKVNEGEERLLKTYEEHEKKQAEAIEKAKQNKDKGVIDERLSDFYASIARDEERRKKKKEEKEERQEAKKANRKNSLGLESYVTTKFSVFFDKIDFMRLNCLDQLDEALKELKNENVKPEIIRDELYNIFCEGVDNLFKNGVIETWDFMKSVSQRTMFESGEYKKDDEYMWVLEDGARHCGDCLEREGKIKTFAKWEAIGLPGAGMTQCGGNCLCSLVKLIIQD